MNGLLFTYAEDYCVYLVVRSVHMIICCSWWYFVSVALQCEITFSSYVFFTLLWYFLCITYICWSVSVMPIHKVPLLLQFTFVHVCLLHVPNEDQSINQSVVCIWIWYLFRESFNGHIHGQFR